QTESRDRQQRCQISWPPDSLPILTVQYYVTAGYLPSEGSMAPLELSVERLFVQVNANHHL
ncbi:hypothetical protein, partial [Yersinia pestis]|uniref:hypothetical protein n=1 Tax=Yersinia pestis TaxID=632 RepID=UPI00050BF25F